MCTCRTWIADEDTTLAFPFQAPRDRYDGPTSSDRRDVETDRLAEGEGLWVPRGEHGESGVEASGGQETRAGKLMERNGRKMAAP